MFRHHHKQHCGPRRGSRHWGPFSVEWEIGEQPDRGRPRRRMFDGAELRLILLKLIEDAPRHGYDLIREIEERSGGAYAPSPGVVYPTLTLLEDMGLIDEVRSEGARKQFAITEAGRAHLAENAEQVTALFARLADLAESREKADSVPVRRAMRNLKEALQYRMMRGETSAEIAHQVAEILDEAAQKIERL